MNKCILYKQKHQHGTHMKRLLSHQAIFDMNQAFKRAMGEKLFTGRISSTFRYAMCKNLETTDKEVSSMLDAFKPDDEYLKYTKEYHSDWYQL